MHYRYGLSIGARCAPVVLALMWILSPVAYPIAKLLDKALGAESPHTYKKAELKSFLQFHRSGEEPLRDDEISVLNGVLELNTKKVDEIMTPIEVHTSFFSLPFFFFSFLNFKMLSHSALTRSWIIKLLILCEQRLLQSWSRTVANAHFVAFQVDIPVSQFTDPASLWAL